jgi:hypothetical protein
MESLCWRIQCSCRYGCHCLPSCACATAAAPLIEKQSCSFHVMPCVAMFQDCYHSEDMAVHPVSS